MRLKHQCGLSPITIKIIVIWHLQIQRFPRIEIDVNVRLVAHSDCHRGEML